MQEGPLLITTKHCTGCVFLKEEYWKDYLENDETDSGTRSTCVKLQRTIAVYHHSQDLTPDWCPYNEPE